MTEPQRFTTKPPVLFFIDDDEFHVLGAIPAEEFAALMDLQEGLGAEGSNNREQYAKIKGILQFVMLPESWGRFEPKLADREHPVDFNLLVRITNWLTGTVWSGKDTGSSPTSSTDQPAETPTGMDGSPPADSDPTGSQSVEVSVVPDTSTSTTTGEPEI
jgi:hypothetical protein